MQRHELDWAFLRQGLVIPLALCGVAVALFMASAWLRSGLAMELDQQQQQLGGMEERRTGLSDRVTARQQFEVRFNAISARGVVGDERRLQWAQTLRDSATALHLPYLRYDAAPQQPFLAPWLAPGVAAPLKASVMEVQAGLVHELDLLRLLARLREAPGLFQVRACDLKRNGHDAKPSSDKPNLTGVCQLQWYSITLPGSEPAA